MTTTETPSYTCPYCGAVSYNPTDILEKYCGRCHRYDLRYARGDDQDTGELFLIPGYQYLSFRGGTLDGAVRLVKEPLHEGDRYHKLVPIEETWEYTPGDDGEPALFVLMEGVPDDER